MPKVIAFRTPRGQRVWINPAHVLKIVSSDSHNAAVHMVGEVEPVIIDGDPDGVAAALNGALS